MRLYSEFRAHPFIYEEDEMKTPAMWLDVVSVGASWFDVPFWAQPQIGELVDTLLSGHAWRVIGIDLDEGLVFVEYAWTPQRSKA